VPFTPGDPWPSTTPGGACLPGWGGYIRFWLLAEIAAGFPFALGAAANDRLDAGNVLSDASMVRFGPPIADPTALPVTSGLWVDLSCDLTDCEITAGAATSAGVLSKAEAGTLTATLFDPTGKYDPLNPDTPYALAGRSRLVPGIRIVALCEVVNNPTVTTPTVTQSILFTGTADRWAEDWTKDPGDRRAKLTASDLTKNLVKLDRDEQAPQGAGETVATRLSRIADYFGFGRPLHNLYGTEAAYTEQATTLAQSAWELLNRTMDDELGFLWVDAQGRIIWTAREIWQYRQFPPLQLGCGGTGFYDIVTDATPLAIDATQVNRVAAARTGGTTQTATNTASINRWGERSYQRTDLGLADDTQTAKWAQDFVNLAAYPRYAVDSVTVIPAVAAQSWTCWADLWKYLLDYRGYSFIAGLFRVVFESDLFAYTVDTTVRMVGYQLRVDPDQWTVQLRTVDANLASGAHTFHAGAHANDRLDAGNVAA